MYITNQQNMKSWMITLRLFQCINGNNSVLQKQVEELAEKTTSNDFLLKAKLQEKDDVLATLSDQVMKLMAEVQELKQKKN